MRNVRRQISWLSNFDCINCGTLLIYLRNCCKFFLNRKTDEWTNRALTGKSLIHLKTLNLGRQASIKSSYLSCRIHASWFSVISFRFPSEIVLGFLLLKPRGRQKCAERDYEDHDLKNQLYIYIKSCRFGHFLRNSALWLFFSVDICFCLSFSLPTLLFSSSCQHLILQHKAPQKAPGFLICESFSLSTWAFFNLWIIYPKRASKNSKRAW